MDKKFTLPSSLPSPDELMQEFGDSIEKLLPPPPRVIFAPDNSSQPAPEEWIRRDERAGFEVPATETRANSSSVEDAPDVDSGAQINGEEIGIEEGAVVESNQETSEPEPTPIRTIILSGTTLV